MKKSILMSITAVLVLLLVVGCAQTPITSTDTTDEVVTEEAGEVVTEVVDEAVTEEKDMTQEEDMAKDEEMPGVLTDAGYIDLTPEEAMLLMKTTPDLVVVDVSPRYAQGHLPGAINYYIGDGSLEAALPTLDKSKPYLVYCHTDGASIPGAEMFVEAGFSPVYRLLGNYSAWEQAGFPIEK